MEITESLTFLRAQVMHVFPVLCVSLRVPRIAFRAVWAPRTFAGFIQVGMCEDSACAWGVGDRLMRRWGCLLHIRSPPSNMDGHLNTEDNKLTELVVLPTVSKRCYNRWSVTGARMGTNSQGGDRIVCASGGGGGWRGCQNVFVSNIAWKSPGSDSDPHPPSAGCGMFFSHFCLMREEFTHIPYHFTKCSVLTGCPHLLFS